MPELIDNYRRKIVKLRVSVTDRCPLRCVYCSPDRINFLPREKILRIEEILTIIKIFTELGIYKIRLTGGEPLVRKGLISLIEGIKNIKRVADLALTTNGQDLVNQAFELKKAGLNRINVSLDTLEPEKYIRLTGGGNLDKTLSGLQEAVRAGLKPIKINTVILKGINDNEIENLVSFSLENGFSIRFIELMSNDGMLNSGFKNKVVHNLDIKKHLMGILSKASRKERKGHEELFLFDNGKTGIGFISPESEPFCNTCDKLRLTSWGELLECLYAKNGLSLRDLVRNGTSEEEIKQKIIEFVNNKCYSKYGRHNLDMKSIGG